MTDPARAAANLLPGEFLEVPRRVYRHDPILEAVCELRFRAPSDAWAVLPGQLFDRLRDAYPAQPTADGPPFLGGPEIASPGGPTVQFVVGPAIPGRVRLADLSGTRQLLVAPRIITMSSLRPYDGWERFFGRIEEMLQVFGELVPSFDVERIGLRYINRLDIPNADIGEYFDVQPLSLGTLPFEHLSFLCRSELGVRDNPDRVLIATFGTAVPSPDMNELPSSGARPFVLDLDAVAQNLDGVSDLPSIRALITELRLIEKSAFEAAITETARQEIFGGYETRADV